MKNICIIPARMGSTRFPGKPLVKALEIPLIVHVAKRCMLSPLLDMVFVATCDEEIKKTCDLFKIKTIMTSSHHERCTDRVSEAIKNSGLSLCDDDLVLMVQGDEILIEPEMINSVVSEYKKIPSPVINLLSRIKRLEDLDDPNVVKAVYGIHNQALYFSRSPLPSMYRSKDMLSYQQTGVIGFSNKFLKEFSVLRQTPLEIIESIDMLRILENGLPVRVVLTDKETIAIDMPYDLERAIQVLKNDDLIKKYA